MARLGRRQAFKPIINVGGKYQPAIVLQRLVQVSALAADAIYARRARPLVPARIIVGGQYQPPVRLQNIVQVNRADADSTRRRKMYPPIFGRIPPEPAVVEPPAKLQRIYQTGIAITENTRPRKLFKPFSLKLPILAPPSIAQYVTADVRIAGATYVYNFPMNNLQASVPPGFSDDGAAGYSPGSLWIDKVGGHAYICVSAVSVGATWKQID